MSLVLNTNIDALIAQNSLTTSGSQLTTALQQLSSGLQINSAADNAAGYAIAQGMTSQINGLNTATNNTNDGVSLTQTAQGSLQQITNDLQTMRNLAVQSLNATNSSQDRQDLNQQFQQLAADINQVAQTASFNGVNLLDGSFQGATFQIGANAGQTITVASVSSAAANNLGQLYTSTSAGAGAYTSTGATGGTAVANGDSGSFTVKFGNNTYTTGAVSLTGNQATDLKTIAAAITQATGNSGVVATVNSAGTGINLSSTTQQAVNITYSGTTGHETLSTFGLSQYNTLGGFTAAGTGISSTAYGNLNIPGGETLTGSTAPTAATLAINSTATGYLTIGSSVISLGFTSTNTATASAEATFVAQQIQTQGASSGITASVNTSGAISVQYAGTSVPAVSYSVSPNSGTGTAGPSLSDLFGSTTSFSANTAPDTATFTVKIGTGSSATTVTANPVSLTGNQATDLQAVANAITTAAGMDGVTASVNAAGTAIDLNSNTSQTVTVSAVFAGGGTAGAAQGSETAASFGFAGTGGSTAITTAATASSTVNTSNVGSVDSSNQVLIQMDAALQQIATTGAQLGAYQNRFQAAVTGLQTDSQNLSAAKSQIVDTNYAQATSNLSKAQILQQASTSMVAQANTIPQNILTLLQKLP